MGPVNHDDDEQSAGPRAEGIGLQPFSAKKVRLVARSEQISSGTSASGTATQKRVTPMRGAGWRSTDLA